MINSILIVVLIGLFSHRITSELALYFRRQKLKQSNGCQPCPQSGRQGGILGLSGMSNWFRAAKTGSLNTSLYQTFKEIGHTFQVAAGSKSRIYCIDTRNLSVIWNRGSRDWGLGPVREFALEPFVGKGIMSSDGETWERSRALVRPIFAREQIENVHLEMMERCLQHMFKLIPGDGSTVDLQPLLGRLALDMSTEFLFGESVNTLLPETTTLDAKTFLDSYSYGQQGAALRLYLPQYNFFTRDIKFWRSCQIARDFVERHVDRAYEALSLTNTNGGTSREKKPQTSAYILAHSLVEQTTNREEVVNQLRNVFLPAHDAIAVVLTNTFFILARHPPIWAKLRQDLDERGLLAADPKLLSTEELSRLPYLEQVLKETFRLHPTIGIMSRCALHDTVLPKGGGPEAKDPLFVPKGGVVSLHVYALHRRKDTFGHDAESFRPERWETLHPTHYEYMPFGRGPRTCPAEKMATAQVRYGLVRFLQLFSRLENRDPVHEFVEVYKMSTESKNGAKVGLFL